MRKRLLIGAVLLLTAQFGSLASAEVVATVARANTLGCQKLDKLTELTQLSVNGNSRAFADALSAAKSNGECTTFRLGEKVIVAGEDSIPVDLSAAVVKMDRPALLVVKIQRRGETTAYWAVRGAVRLP